VHGQKALLSLEKLCRFPKDKAKTLNSPGVKAIGELLSSRHALTVLGSDDRAGSTGATIIDRAALIVPLIVVPPNAA
jgi:hypothetical protein